MGETQSQRQFVSSNNFSLGEFSPLFHGRSDIPAYRNGAARLLNRRPLTLGGNGTRPGLKYFATLSNTPAVLAPFVFSPSQRYIVVFSDARAEIWTWDGTPCTTLTGCPWTTADLDEITWAQQFDTMIVCHPTFKPRRLFRTGATTFTLSEIPIEVPAFDRFSAPDVEMAIASKGASGTATTGTVSHAIVTNDLFLNKQFRIEGFRLRVTQVTSTTTFNCVWIDDTSGYTAPGSYALENASGGRVFGLFEPTTSGAATTTPSGQIKSFTWQEEAWQDAYGYPGVVAFADGRLWFASSTDRPTTVWASKPGAYYNFDIGEAADGDGINDTMLGDGLGSIRHLLGLERNIVLTENSGAFMPESEQRPVTPSTIAFRPFARAGASRARPHQFDGAALYAHRNGKIINEVLWSDTLQTYQINPVSLIAEHLIQNPVQMSVLESSDTRPERLALIVNSDGSMAALHSLRTEQVAAWVPWETNGDFKSVAGVDTTAFVIVERDGTWFLETFDDNIPPLDCCEEATNGSPTRSFSGFTHLAGKTVAVVTSGHDLGDLTVSAGGVITLTDEMPAVETIHAGLRFDQMIKPLPFAIDVREGSTRTRRKRLVACHVQVHESHMFKIGGKTMLMEQAGDTYDEEPPTFTGIITAPQLQVDQEAQVEITDAGAYKFTVLTVTREVQING